MIYMTVVCAQKNYVRLKEPSIETTLGLSPSNLVISLSGEIRDNEAEPTSLSDNDMQEIRKIVAKAKAEEAEAVQTAYDEKICSLRSKAGWTLKSLLDKCTALNEYRDAQYVGHKRGNTILILPGGKAIGFGFAGHASGAAAYFYKTFKFWGFTYPCELYFLPAQHKTEFFDKGIEFVESVFGKDAEGLQKLLNTVDQEDDPLQLKSLQLKAEDLTTETTAALTAIAESVKEKAQADERRSIQIRLKKQLSVARRYWEEHFSG